VDLLLARDLVRLTRDPDRFAAEVEALPPGRWVVVDEVQRLPALLDQVQHVLVRHPRRWRFALTGSSARRLEREQANLLAGRVINRRFFPPRRPTGTKRWRRGPQGPRRVSGANAEVARLASVGASPTTQTA